MKVSIRLKFLGGVADGVHLTGSCTYIEVAIGKQITRILVDTGMWQGSYVRSFKENSSLKTDFAKVDAVVWTHSHVDHIGRFPYFFKKGFKGSVYCTEPTSRVSEIMLSDTAKILSSEVNYRLRKERKTNSGFKTDGNNKSKDRNKEKYNKKSKGAASKISPVLFSEEDVKNSLVLIKNDGYEYYRWIKIEKGIWLKFYPSGHVLGGAICVFKIANGASEDIIYLGFSGDLGRQDGIILPPPEIPEEKVDFWFVESTYGGICHPSRKDEADRIFQIIREAASNQKKVLMPSFAFERTQEIIYLLSNYIHNGDIPKMPIYLDAPLANRITRVFRDYWRTPMFRDQGMLRDFNPFDPAENKYLHVVETDEASALLSKLPGPYILISGAGMCEAGRIRNHLRQNLSDSKTVVCLIGFMAPGTLGRRLQDGLPIIVMNGEDIKVEARIEKFQSFSAHADGPFIVSYSQEVINREPRFAGKSIFLLHGEERGASCIKNDLVDSLGKEWLGRIHIPELNESIKLL